MPTITDHRHFRWFPRHSFSTCLIVRTVSQPAALLHSHVWMSVSSLCSVPPSRVSVAGTDGGRTSPPGSNDSYQCAAAVKSCRDRTALCCRAACRKWVHLKLSTKTNCGKVFGSILIGICCPAWLFHTSILTLPMFVRGQMSVCEHA